MRLIEGKSQLEMTGTNMTNKEWYDEFIKFYKECMTCSRNGTLLLLLHY